jgi:hypothetical protein
VASVQARAPAPRVYPADRAAELFAVCEPELAGRRLSVEGRRIVAVPFERFSLLLSYVDPKAYSVEELERRRGDGPWQAIEARVQERAVERASQHGAVLPMRSFTIVEKTSDLEAYVSGNAVRWSRSLARLGGSRECAVHLYAGPHVSLFTTEPYSIRVARHVTRSTRLPVLAGTPEVVEYAREVWQACTSVAQATRRIGPGERRGILWSAVLLLAAADVTEIAKVLERSAVAGAALGVTTYLEGPRAPYSFV